MPKEKKKKAKSVNQIITEATRPAYSDRYVKEDKNTPSSPEA